MAPFNPQVQPTQDPNWTNVSKPISDVIPDKSSAIAITAGTQVMDESVKLADTLTKQSIQTDTYQGVDRLRDAYTDSLKQVRNAQLASAAGAPDPAVNPSLLPDGNTAPVPGGLQSGLARVQQIGTALAQGGTKINDTLYTGALNSLSKQLRTSYPGYRDYIDDQIKSVSGVDPANAFYKNLMEDINKNVENNKTENNATLATLRSNADSGFHDKLGVSAAQVYEGVKNGSIDNTQALKWLNGAKSLEYDLKTKATNRGERQADDADSAITAGKDISSATGKIIAQGWTTMTIGKGTDTPEKLFNFIQKNAGNPDVMDEKSVAIGQQLQSMRRSMFQAAWTAAQEGGPNSMMARAGNDADAVKKKIESQFANMDMAVDAVFNKDWGSAYSHMHMNEAIKNDTTNLLYNIPDSEARIYNRSAAAITQISPQFAKDFFRSSVLGNVPKDEKELLKGERMKMLTQPLEAQGSLVSAQSTLDKLRASGASSPKTFDEFMNSVNYLTDPKLATEQKINLAKGFFDPVANKDLLSDKNFQKDQIVNGRQVPGKFAIYSRLSSPDVANAIGELAKKNPSIGESYKTMMSQQFGEQLFNREIRDLGTTNESVTSHTGYKVGYVNEKGSVPRFAILRPDNTEMTNAEALAVRAPVASTNRLNGSIAGMYNVYSATGSKDPGTDILNTMYQHGYQEAKMYNMDKGWSGDATDVPKMFWRSLVSSQQDRLRKAGEQMQKQQ